MTISIQWKSFTLPPQWPLLRQVQFIQFQFREAGAAALFFSQTKKDHHSYAGVAGMESETAPYEKTKQTFKVPMKCQVRVDKCLSSTSVVSENSIAN